MGYELEMDLEIIYDAVTGRSTDWDLREDNDIEESIEDYFDIVEEK